MERALIRPPKPKSSERMPSRIKRFLGRNGLPEALVIAGVVSVLSSTMLLADRCEKMEKVDKFVVCVKPTQPPNPLEPTLILIGLIASTTGILMATRRDPT